MERSAGPLDGNYTFVIFKGDFGYTQARVITGWISRRADSPLLCPGIDSDDLMEVQCRLVVRALLLLVLVCGPVTGSILYRVPEEQPPNTLIGSLAADQGLPDSGHLYKLEVGTPYLRVDGKTGDIFTTEIPIDRETLKDCRTLLKGKPCYLEFEVSVTDLIQNQSPRLIEGRIEVQDINDNTPQFPSSVLTISVPENTVMGALFSIPLATDRDSERNGVADYALTAGLDAATLFGLQVAEDRGEKLPQLIVLGNLDRELKDSYDLTIKAVDGGNPQRYSSALLRVLVTDANDNSPKFEKSTYEAEVSENSPMGHSVLQVKANDSDMGPNGEIEYTLHQAVEPVPRLLRIDRSSGVIYVKGPLDREEISSLSFYVVAKDKGPQPKSSKTFVTIEVTDQNDNAPAVEIRGIGLVTHSKGIANISEDMPVGTAVALVQVSDKDEGENAVVTCVVAGDVPFQLRPASDSSSDNKRKYFLQTTTPLDFERLFRISPTSGEITLAKEMTRKHGGLHRLVVRVSDRGKPSRHATALVHIYVNETISNVSLVETLVGHSLDIPLDRDIAGDRDNGFAAQRSNILFGSLVGVAGVVMLILAVVFIRHRIQRETKSGYQAGKKETKDLYAPKQVPKNTKGKRGRKGKPQKSPKPLGEDEEVSLQKSLKFNLDGVNDSPRIHLPLTYSPGSPDIGRHYRSNSPLPSIQLQAQSPSASQKHQAVQDLPAANTFVGTGGDDNSTGSDQYSDYSYKTGQQKYNKQVRRDALYSRRTHIKGFQTVHLFGW
uniref:Cadherin domain-containing protein n=1 Tax=Knipowitschia caucasica TaxID=637954 RepID=A0AAV2J873_KNICA